MVSYTKFVSLVFEVADDQIPATEVMSWAADQWGQRKEAIKASTVSETRQWLRRNC